MNRATPEDVIFICACAVKRKELRAELRKLTYEKIAEIVGLSESHTRRIAEGEGHKKQQRAMRNEIRNLHNKAAEGQVADHQAERHSG